MNDSRLGYRVRNFKTICDAHPVSMELGLFRFEFEENTSDLGVGDRVLVHSGAISSTPSFHGYVRSVDAHHVSVRIPLNNISEDTLGKGSWTIDRFPSDQTSTASQTALFDFLRAPPSPSKRVVLSDLDAVDAERSVDEADIDPGRSGLTSRLNSSQVEAVRKAAGCPVFHLIWGPPGTGKTRVVPEIVDHVSGGILLGAFTNTALDKMLLSVLDMHPEMPFLRMGRSKGLSRTCPTIGRASHRVF